MEKARLRGGFLVDYGGRFDLQWVGVGCGVIVGFYGVARGGGGGFWSTPVVLVVGYAYCLLQTKTKIIIIINK